MNEIAASYAAIVLISVYTCGYSIWGYYECSATRSHKPYVFPMFLSVGWFFFGINGLLTINSQDQAHMDAIAVKLLSAATLLALLVFVYHYSRSRRNEA